MGVITRPYFVIVSLLIGLAGFAAADAPRLRPPAVPLVTHDPYFSIWSPADRLTDADTMHWTGKPHRLTSLVRIDGKPFRLMGKEPADVPGLSQVGVEVLPTRTLCTFEGAGVGLRLTFLTPALPGDLDVLSRPLTYITWEAVARDGNKHDVAVYLDVNSELSVNEPRQAVVWERETLGTGASALEAAQVGSKEQPVLAKKGDDLRIDWGYLYLAYPPAEAGALAIAPAAGTRSVFLSGGTIDPAVVDRRPHAAGEAPVAALAFPLGQVGPRPVSRWAMLAYDDGESIRYFRSKLRPYWRRNGWQASDLLLAAAHDRAALGPRCAAFDAALMADLVRVGGPKYAALCALAYRQTLAGNKIVADASGRPLMFPKENFSNGCIATVDVLFPQAPFFLTFSPALTKAMLVPILDYAASPRWTFAYAPHDLGTYPHATGQVYGGGEKTGENQMPVEESGNMLIMLAALARVEGNAEFSRAYWPQLTKWADYCVAEGLDPVNQLCSADMFGHLPRCANLALKAIIAIGGFAELCDQVGKPDEARKYRAVARQYASKWLVLARDDGHTRLAYHLPGTWGMKHNLIWDRVLGLGLFPDVVGDAEVAWYRRVQKPFGLPVDNRTDTSLIDWALWSIAPTRRDADFQALLEPLYRYVNETPARVPLSDWFVTTDAKQRGFQARPVVGGLFIRMLADRPTWTRWAKRGADVRGPWAPFPWSASPVEIVPTAENRPVAWRYTLETPADGWERPGFDDSAWHEAPAGFGTRGTPGAIVRTTWNTKEIWLRRSFTLPDRVLRNPRLRLIYDEDPEIFLNGVPAARLSGWITAYDEVDLGPAAQAAFRPGPNLLAAHARQTYGGQSIDVGIVEDAPEPARSR
jgi:hypothetical protein